MYDDIIKKAGGFAPYQKLATLLIISSFALFYAQFFSLTFLLQEPNYECLTPGSASWASCSQEQACEAGVEYRFDYSRNGKIIDRESYSNWYEQMNLTCEDPNKVKMIPIAYVIGNVVA